MGVGIDFGLPAGRRSHLGCDPSLAVAVVGVPSGSMLGVNLDRVKMVVERIQLHVFQSTETCHGSEILGTLQLYHPILA